MTPWSLSLMNKVAFLRPIMSRSKRFKSILMPDLDSTAKSNPRNNVLNIAGWFITKFCPSQSCLSCHNVSCHIFGAETPKIEIAVSYKHEKNKKQNKKLKFSGSSHFYESIPATVPHTHTHTHTQKLKGVYIRCKIVKFSMEWLWTLPYL